MITATQFGKRHKISRQRVHILIKQGRIQPRPRLTQVIGGRMQGIYLISKRAKIIPPKVLTRDNGRG